MAHECHANVNADVNGIRTEISAPKEGDKKHMPTYETQCRVYFASCRKLHFQ